MDNRVLRLTLSTITTIIAVIFVKILLAVLINIAIFNFSLLLIDLNMEPPRPDLPVLQDCKTALETELKSEESNTTNGENANTGQDGDFAKGKQPCIKELDETIRYTEGKAPVRGGGTEKSMDKNLRSLESEARIIRGLDINRSKRHKIRDIVTVSFPVPETQPVAQSIGPTEASTSLSANVKMAEFVDTEQSMVQESQLEKCKIAALELDSVLARHQAAQSEAAKFLEQFRKNNGLTQLEEEVEVKVGDDSDSEMERIVEDGNGKGGKAD